jgi:hypothetical protein
VKRLAQREVLRWIAKREKWLAARRRAQHRQVEHRLEFQHSGQTPQQRAAAYSPNCIADAIAERGPAPRPRKYSDKRQVAP